MTLLAAAVSTRVRSSVGDASARGKVNESSRVQRAALDRRARPPARRPSGLSPPPPNTPSSEAPRHHMRRDDAALRTSPPGRGVAAAPLRHAVPICVEPCGCLHWATISFPGTLLRRPVGPRPITPRAGQSVSRADSFATLSARSAPLSTEGHRYQLLRRRLHAPQGDGVRPSQSKPCSNRAATHAAARLRSGHRPSGRQSEHGVRRGRSRTPTKQVSPDRADVLDYAPSPPGSRADCPRQLQCNTRGASQSRPQRSHGGSARSPRTMHSAASGEIIRGGEERPERMRADAEGIRTARQCARGMYALARKIAAALAPVAAQYPARHT
jgi:hypothetical protein